MSNLSVCENIEEKSVIAKPDQEKDGRTKARKKKELKNVEHILKSVHSLESEAKLQVSSSWLPSIGFVFLKIWFCLQAVCGKYAELVEDQKETQSAVKTYERHFQVIQREKEQLQTENSKSILARSRLEELCRELQRQNKVIKGESPSKLHRILCT